MVSIRRFYSGADAVIVPSEGVADDLRHIAGRVLENLHVIPSPVVDDDLTALAQQPLQHPWFAETEPSVVLGVGELSARKDFATLIKAFAGLRAQRPCRLLILGEGRQRQRLLQLADELGVYEHVSLPGFCGQSLFLYGSG